ncbi:MAG TPA: phosphoribosyltransferase family protein [bacterium]|nr:phosphoribosyltransferase family protein [bacterium]
MPLFADRQDAGRALATALADEARNAPVIVALPRGGVAVAAEVARAFEAPLDILGVRKIGVPGQEELAMGAVAEGDVMVEDERTRTMAGISRASFDSARARANAELAERLARLRRIRPRENVRGRTVIVVDEGVATGATASAAVQALRAAGASRIVFAAPIGLGNSRATLEAVADEVIFLAENEGFFAVGQAYGDFGQVEDDEVEAMLRELGGARPPAAERSQ